MNPRPIRRGHKDVKDWLTNLDLGHLLATFEAADLCDGKWVPTPPTHARTYARTHSHTLGALRRPHTHTRKPSRSVLPHTAHLTHTRTHARALMQLTEDDLESEELGFEEQEKPVLQVAIEDLRAAFYNEGSTSSYAQPIMMPTDPHVHVKGAEEKSPEAPKPSTTTTSSGTNEDGGRAKIESGSPRGEARPIVFLALGLGIGLGLGLLALVVVRDRRGRQIPRVSR